MVAPVNRQILLKSRPEGAPSLDNFALMQGPVPESGDGEVLMRTLWRQAGRGRCHQGGRNGRRGRRLTQSEVHPANAEPASSLARSASSVLILALRGSGDRLVIDR